MLMRYRPALEEALAEQQQILNRLQELEAARLELERRLNSVNGAVDALNRLCEIEAQEQDAPQLAALCYHALLNLNRAATAAEVRALVAPQFDLSRYRDSLPVILAALQRVPQIVWFEGRDGRTYFAVREPEMVIPLAANAR
jgi:hypothetical protein